MGCSKILGDLMEMQLWETNHCSEMSFVLLVIFFPLSPQLALYNYKGGESSKGKA